MATEDAEAQWRAYLREKAEQGFETGWVCAECPLLWWSFTRPNGGAQHALKTGHAIVVGPQPFQVTGCVIG